MLQLVRAAGETRAPATYYLGARDVINAGRTILIKSKILSEYETLTNDTRGNILILPLNILAIF